MTDREPMTHTDDDGPSFIEWYHAEGTHLAAHTAGRKDRLGRLLSLPGITRHQVGDTEVRILFPVGMLPEVARAIQARRRRPAPPAASLQALADHRHGSDFRGRGSRRPALAIP